MSKMEVWLYILITVGVAVLANYFAATWGAQEHKWSLLLVAVILVSPIVFITFGLVTNRIGVAIASGTIDSLLTVSTVLLGLVVFGEWNKISSYQYVGLLLVIIGIVLLQFANKTET
jgi:multidrug transporter EmrE-like cation transporter